MTQPELVWAKLGVVAVVLLGMFGALFAGKIDAQTMVTLTTTLIAALVVALGISGAGSAAASAIQQNTRARFALSPDELRRGTDSEKSP